MRYIRLFLLLSVCVWSMTAGAVSADTLNVALSDTLSGTKATPVLSRLVSADPQITEEGHRLEKKKMEPLDYVPQIHGTVRAKYEYCPQEDASRFQVRNARFSLTGNVHQMVAYKAEIDLSDKGKTRMLDAYVRVIPVKGLSFTLGQMKIPFSTDNLRSPHNLYFPNRAFIAKQITNLRDVGFTAAYDASQYVPIEVVAGVFNGAGLTNQSDWQKRMNYSARINVKPVKYFSFSFNWQSIEPVDLRMNLFDVGLMSDFYGVHLEAEGVYKIYQNRKFAPSYGFTGFAAYDLPLPAVFHHLRFLARYDMMNENYSGEYNAEHTAYEAPDPFRQRITAGVTLALAKPILAELRINYEKYFYRDWALADPSEQDKLVIELVARF